MADTRLTTGDIVEIRNIGSLFGQLIMNVYHYRVNDPSTFPTYWASIQSVAEAFDSGTNNPTLATLACQTSAYVLIRSEAQRIYPTRDRTFKAPSGLPGTNVGTCLSPNQAATLEKFAVTGGRHGVGSVHIAGVPSEQQQDGKWKAPYITLLTTVAHRLGVMYEIPLDTLNLIPIIFNRQAPSSSVEVKDGLVNDTVRVMRRRTVGVGK